MPIDLTPDDLLLVKEKIEEGLETLTAIDDEPRTHLGISEIGKPCSRQLYYKFHWAAFEKHSGRMQRLFKRGHREEERFINYLEGIGCKVYRFQQELWYSSALNDYKVLEINADKSGGTGSYEEVKSLYHLEQAKKLGIELKQFRVSGVMGHYGGSCDGVVITPWFENPFLLEMKTHNTKSFINYLDKGLIKSKPQHYDQMNGYGFKMQIQYGLYFPENKNDDDIQVTAIKLDWKRGEQLERKAEEIITAKQPPQKISENPDYYECQYCFAKEICHYGAELAKNCRSCRMSSAVEGAEWYCSRYGENIPKEIIAKGCDGWCPI